MHLRLLTYNILHCGGDHRSSILNILRESEANVIVLQEADHPDTVKEFSQNLNMQCYMANNIALLSQFPIAAGYCYRSFPRIHDTMLEATISLPSGALLHVFGVHPIHFPGTFLDYWRNWQLRIVPQRATHYAQEYCLIAGDFNAIASTDLVRLDKAPVQMRLLYWLQGGRIFTTTIRNILDTGFVDCYRQLHPQDDGFTLPTGSPKLRLDYIFANRTMQSLLRRCDVLQEPPEVHRASDHYPIMAEFELED